MLSLAGSLSALALPAAHRRSSLAQRLLAAGIFFLNLVGLLDLFLDNGSSLLRSGHLLCLTLLLIGFLLGRDWLLNCLALLRNLNLLLQCLILRHNHSLADDYQRLVCASVSGSRSCGFALGVSRLSALSRGNRRRSCSRFLILCSLLASSLDVTLLHRTSLGLVFSYRLCFFCWVGF